MPDFTWLKKVPVKVPKPSGFDMSYQNLLTAPVGTLVPIHFKEVIPNTQGKTRIAVSASLPPLASDTFMRCSLKLEAFFVPSRLLNGSYEEWLTGSTVRGPMTGDEITPELPYVVVTPTASGSSIITDPGSLADYLGYKAATSYVSAPEPISLSLLPFLGYQLIYDSWYRNALIQKPLFYKSVGPVSTSAYNSICADFLPSATFTSTSNQTLFAPSAPLIVSSVIAARYKFSDGSTVFDLRQRNFGADYFTIATTSPQKGSAQALSFTVDTSTGDGSFTVAALRAVNSMQQFAERNQLVGPRMVDYCAGQYGAHLSDAVAQRPVLLGAGSYEVYSKGIYQNSESATSTNNPFSGVTGAEFGSARASGGDFVFDYDCQEPGYIYVLASLVPRATYSTGLARVLTRYTQSGSQTDMANPILQNVGNQPIYQYELTGAYISSNPIFGYTERYADWKTRQDELHGLLRDGQSLDAFALQRGFYNNTSISDSFLQIPRTYLDQVAAASYNISDYGVWIDSYIDDKCVMPLDRYAIPSLQDPAYEHGKTVMTQRGGKRLD